MFSKKQTNEEAIRDTPTAELTVNKIRRRTEEKLGIDLTTRKEWFRLLCKRLVAKLHEQTLHSRSTQDAIEKSDIRTNLSVDMNDAIKNLNVSLPFYFLFTNLC